MDKTISLHLNKGRKVRGTLRGYDQFMNIVLGDAVEDVPGSEQNKIGMVVSLLVIPIENRIDSCMKIELIEPFISSMLTGCSWQ